MASQNGALKKALTATTATTGGAVAAINNDSGEDRIITDVFVDVTTKSTGVALLDIGVAANGTTTNDSLIDGVDVNAAVGLFDLVINAGTNGKNARRWDSGQFITVTGNASTAGLVGNLYIKYVVV